MRSATRKLKPIPVYWERGYDFSHIYWVENRKVGSVCLKRHATDANLRYHWQADSFSGYETTLERAKSALEHAFWITSKQLRLF